MNRLSQIQSLLAETPDDSFLLFALAKEYEKGGKEDKALAQYRKLTDKAPNYVGTYYHLGKLHEERDEIPEAMAAYEKGMLVAQEQGDSHAYHELQGARLNASML